MHAQINRSTRPCWRRIQRLEKEGYIQRRVALLSPGKLNVGVTVFALISQRQREIAQVQIAT